MNESVRDLLRQGADAVERPQLDVGHLVAQAERRMLRRRVATVAASAAAVAMIVTGGFALRPNDQRPSPAPPVPVETPETPEPTQRLGTRTYFAAHPGDSGDPSTVLFDDGEADIYLRREGEPVRRIVSTKADEGCPAVSPDGAHLVYDRGQYSDDVAPPADVVVVGLDPAGLPVAGSQQVLLLKAVSTCPQWSPDGRSLAVIAEGRDWATPELRVVTLEGEDRVLAILPPYSSHFAWSPDGDAVAYLTEDAVWIAPVDRGDPELYWRSTSRPDQDPQGIPLPSAPTWLRWLRTGELAVVVLADRAADGWPYVPEGPGVLHLIDVESGHHETIVIAEHEVPLFSPDESRIAYYANDARGFQVYDRATRSTVTLRPQLDDGAFDITGLEWSPDGERLLAGAQRGPDSQGGPFARVSFAADGSSVELLTPWVTGRWP